MKKLILLSILLIVGCSTMRNMYHKNFLSYPISYQRAARRIKQLQKSGRKLSKALHLWAFLFMIQPYFMCDLDHFSQILNLIIFITEHRMIKSLDLQQAQFLLTLILLHSKFGRIRRKKLKRVVSLGFFIYRQTILSLHI